MTAARSGPVDPTSQPGQRALRVVPLPIESSPPDSPPSVSVDSPTLLRLQRDLEAARCEANSLRELLDELPAILERKFQLRLQALLVEQDQLQQDNALLQGHLIAFLRGESLSNQPPLLPDSSIEASQAEPAERDDSPITRGLGLRRALRLRHL